MANNEEKRNSLSRIRMLTNMKKSSPKKKDSLTLLKEMMDSCDDCLDPIPIFSEKQLSQATNNYDSLHLLPNTSDSEYKWYKGSLEGQIVLIKKPEGNWPSLDHAIRNIGMSAEMNSQFNSLKLIGICLQPRIPIMVYEFASNGTLSHYIHNSKGNGSHLPWRSRLRIASEIATIVSFLHTAFRTPIIHRDIKPSNVFLDRQYVAKLSDFSLSLLLPNRKTQAQVEVCGTIGFICREYYFTGTVTVKSDVFSFGMLLFELLTGQRVSDLLRLVQDDQYASFREYFNKILQSDEVNSILDHRILEERGWINYVQQQVQAVSVLALRCIEDNVDERPTMVDVTNQLKQISNLCPQKASRFNYDQTHKINWEIKQQLAMHTAYIKQEKRHHYFWQMLTRLKKSSSHDRSTLLLEEMIESCSVSCDPIRSFSAKELEQATNNYHSSHEFHKEGWCRWYKGKLYGRYISVKKVVGDDISNSYLDRVIDDTVIALHMNTHTNVLKLIGICLETRIPIPVYEYAENGKLLNNIRISSEARARPLLWKSRLRIATEIAKTVAYLHTAFVTPIIYRDIKGSHVFLDQHDVAKLSDFHLAIEIPEGDTQAEDAVRGTIGFIAPEYLATGTMTEKADVFSFGMLLLELLTGQKVFDLERLANDDDVMLSDYFKNHVRSNKVNQILDPTIMEDGWGTEVEQQVQAVSWLALRCTRSNVEERPTMPDVAMQLEQIAEASPMDPAMEIYGQPPADWETFQ